MKAPTPNRRGLSDLVYEHVKQQLFESHFLPGEWLPIDQIASALSVSRQPVMDCMKRLAVDGFLMIVPQVGCQVRSYTQAEIHDFYRLFAAGEALVAELATQRATPQDLMQLTLISGQIGALSQQALGAQELAQLYRSLNRSFHGEMRRIARSPSVTEAVERMGDRSDFFIATAGHPLFGETLQEAHEEHEQVLHAMAQRDSQAAALAIRQHIEGTDRRLQALLSTDKGLAAAESERG